MKKIIALIALLALSAAPIFANDKEKIIIEKRDLIKLIETSEECAELSQKKKLKYKATVSEDKKTLLIEIIVSEKLKHIDDMKYNFPISFSSKIKAVNESEKRVEVTLEDGDDSFFRWKSMLFGASIGSVLTIIAILAI